ncbi:HAMP domain-containing sensor histidine kinase [Mucilaginibacter sp. PAMB04274]|uniref:sensor histidine kinase n=1 Tax=Mucilaginibacter sp. PAMB04274 TaxID=3138568 RepID=UPI00333439B6
MDTYYFKSIPSKYRSAYKRYYMLQNLNTIQVACMVFFCLNLAIHIFTYLVPPSITHIHNYPEFSLANWTCLVITPIFYLAGHQLIKQFKKRSNLAISLGYVLTFCIYLLACGMLFNFIATSDPSNSIIIYLVALIAVASVYTLEYQETLLLTVVNALLFTLLLMYVRADPTEIIYNELLLVVLSGIFFFVSRHVYTYRAGEYLQFRIIKEKNIEIEKAGAFKNDVLGMVAHDLRNPIGAIESIALLMEMDELDDDTRENTAMIRTSCRKAMTIINDLLEVARNDNSDVLNYTLVNMNDFLRDLVQVWKHMSDFTNQLKLTVPDRPVHASINPEKFHRVIDNLISNAAKFSKEKDTIELKLYEHKNLVHIEVKDNGMGIPASLIPNIFDRFSKAGRNGLKGEQSTGLGLSISKQIVEMHNGRIDVQSEEGKGSTFTIRLPEIEADI